MVETGTGEPGRGMGAKQVRIGRAEPSFPLGGVPALARHLQRLPVGHRASRRRWRHGIHGRFERFNYHTEDGRVEPITVRVTHVYRREDGEWKIVHRHGDLAPVDESPPLDSSLSEHAGVRPRA